LLKEPGTGLNVGGLQTFGKIFSLSFTTDSGLLESLLLLLDGRALFNWLAVTPSASEEHVGDAVSDG